MTDTIQESTTRYGVVTIIDSALTLETVSGEIIPCSAPDSMFAILSARQGEQVGVCGILTWRIADLMPQWFEITEITPYRQIPIADALRNLQEVIGDTYDDLDIESLIDDLRGRD